MNMDTNHDRPDLVPDDGKVKKIMQQRIEQLESDVAELKAKLTIIAGIISPALVPIVTKDLLSPEIVFTFNKELAGVHETLNVVEKKLATILQERNHDRTA